MSETILIVDDDLSQLKMTEQAVAQKLGYRAMTAASGREALQWLAAGRNPAPGLVLIALTMPGMDGLEVIRRVRAQCPGLPIIALYKYGEDDKAAQAIKVGATDFLCKPVALERLRLSIQSALTIRRMGDVLARFERASSGQAHFSDIVGQHPLLKEAAARAAAAATLKTPVWIEGGPGTGKELLARCIHGAGRPGSSFTVADGAALPDSGNPLPRHWRQSEGGTLLLRRAHLLAPSLQPALTKLLGEGDVRLICAAAEVPPPSFDPTLRHLLREALITLPPLDARKSDIPLLAKHFVIHYAAVERKAMYGLTEPALQHLVAASWPGNVRQLGQLIWRSVLMCNQELLDAGNIRLMQQLQPAQYQDDLSAAPALLDPQGRVRKLKAIEEEAIRLAILHADGCMARAARSLGIGRSTLYRRVSELGMSGYISRANQTTRPTMKVSSTLRS